MENNKKNIDEKLVNNTDVWEQNDFEKIELTDCDVPINCPFGLDPAEDLFPNHH